MQVFFDTKTFKGCETSTAPKDLETSRLLHETMNLCRMRALTPGEKQAAFNLMKRNWK